MSARTLAIGALRALRLNRIAARIYYRHVHGFASAGHELPESVERCLKRAIENRVADKGDYLEFGVFKGHTFLQAQLSAKKLGLRDMRFFGFDSFEGLPEVVGIDDTEVGEFYKGQYACSLAQVRKSLDGHGVDWTRTELIKGYFDKSLTAETSHRLGLKKIAVALIDCDLYSSAVDVLNFIEPLLQDGCILIMDDWNSFNGDDNKGERLAFREFLARHPGWRAEPLFSYGNYGHVLELRSRQAVAPCAADLQAAAS